MANFSIEFFSNCLRRPVTFKMYIPNDPVKVFVWGEGDKYKTKPIKTLFLLHGYTGAAGNWVPEELSKKYNIAIVMPSGENGFWVDGISTGHMFGTFLTIELVDYVRETFGLAKTKEDTYIMGMSMGGFGALHAAFSCPDRFGKAIALSPAYIIHQLESMKPGDDNGMANYEYYRECFGELKEAKNSKNNPEVLIDELIKNNTNLPEIYIAIGTEDFLLDVTRDFHDFLISRNVKHTYIESKGGHDMTFWDEYCRKFIPVAFADNCLD